MHHRLSTQPGAFHHAPPAPSCAGVSPVCDTKLCLIPVTHRRQTPYCATRNPLDSPGLRHNFASQTKNLPILPIFRPEYRVILQAKVLFFSTHMEKA